MQSGWGNDVRREGGQTQELANPLRAMEPWAHMKKGLYEEVEEGRGNKDM